MFGLVDGDNGFENMIKRSFLSVFEVLNIYRWPAKAWNLAKDMEALYTKL